MSNWLLDDLWQEQSMPWFLPLPPPPQLVYSSNNSPVNSFFDYMHPVVDRLVRIDLCFFDNIRLFVFILVANIYRWEFI